MSIEKRLAAIARLGPRSGAFARHVYQKIAALTIGRAFVSPAGQALRKRLAAGWNGPAAYPPLKLAIVAHVYYPDILDEIIACKAILPDDATLFVTTTPDKIETSRQYLRGTEPTAYHASENRGRDIWPFVDLLNSGALDGYDAVLKIHTKRSPHLLDGEIRRKLLFTMLCGERNATAKALSAFTDSRTGIVGWDACWREAPPYWMDNRPRVEGLARRMGAAREAMRLGFFEGSMFWFRPSALAAIKEMSLSRDDFEPEAGQVDGTLHHALERCFSIAAWSRGYEVRDMKGRLLRGASPP